jgi:hypothetical protein
MAQGSALYGFSLPGALQYVLSLPAGVRSWLRITEKTKKARGGRWRASLKNGPLFAEPRLWHMRRFGLSKSGTRGSILAGVSGSCFLALCHHTAS